MNILSQEAQRRQAVVKFAIQKGNRNAAEKYGVSLCSVKRWQKRWDGSWQSLREKSHRPHSHPAQHTKEEEAAIRQAFSRDFLRYGWDGVFHSLRREGYQRSFSGMVCGKTHGAGSSKQKEAAKKT